MIMIVGNNVNKINSAFLLAPNLYIDLYIKYITCFRISSVIENVILLYLIHYYTRLVELLKEWIYIDYILNSCVI